MEQLLKIKFFTIIQFVINWILVKKLSHRIEEFQQQNVMMFTRIMDKLGRSADEESDAFGTGEFPCASQKELEKWNDLCVKDKDVKKNLVTNF